MDGRVVSVLDPRRLVARAIEGIKREANGYVASREVDVWVSLMNSNNLIRSSSYMLNTLGEALDTMPEVARVAPLLRSIARIEKDGGSAAFFVLVPGPQKSRSPHNDQYDCVNPSRGVAVRSISPSFLSGRWHSTQC